MKKTGIRIFAFLLVIVLCLGTVFATTKGSDYFAVYAVKAYAFSGAKLTFQADIDATHTVDNLGMSCIVVQEKQTNGTWKNVETTYAADESTMLEANAFSTIVRHSYYGTVGKQYRASIVIYADDEKGSDSRALITNTVTAIK